MKHHVQASIEGLLKLTNKKLGRMFNGNGREIRAELKQRLLNGEVYIGSENCEGFDPVKGCPGHNEEA